MIDLVERDNELLLNAPLARRGRAEESSTSIAPLVSDLQSIAAFAQDEGRSVELRVSPAGLSVRSAHAQTGHGQASIHATVAGRPVISIVNVAYLIEALSAVDDLEAEISFNGPNKPLVVRPASGREYVHVVMPIHSKST
jgi:DNA polymerase III sliding clamp (beta) subunit (PCNA family)